MLDQRSRRTLPGRPGRACPGRIFCQTVASFKREPFRFSDASLGLDYGSSATDFTAADVDRAFADTLDWMEERAVHAGLASLPAPFAVYEAWTADADEPAFQTRLGAF